MVRKSKATVNVYVPSSHLEAVRRTHERQQETLHMMNEHLARSMPDLSAVVNTLTFPNINLFGDMTAAIEAVQPRLDLMNSFLQSPGVQGMFDSINAISKAAENMLSFHPVFTPVNSPDETAEEAKDEATVPTVFEQVHVDMLSCLPEEAEQLDDYIAIDGKNRAYFRVGNNWMPHAVGKQSIRIVQYLKAAAPYPNKRLVSSTELGNRFSDAVSARQRRVAACNRLRELEKLCERYGCKPIAVKSARKRCLNPELTSCEKFRW